MQPLNCLVVDDDELDRLLIEQHIQSCSWLKRIGSFANPLECLPLLAVSDVQILFLDIDMPVINGINFIKTLPSPPLCVFITNHPDYALEAFDVHAFDYILKPVTKERFTRTLERLAEYVEIRAKVQHYDAHLEQDTITFKEGTAVAKVTTGDIIYLEALANYTKVVTPERNYITLRNLKSFLEELPSDKFLRVHRSYAVAVKKITGLDKADVLLGKYKVPFGKTYRKNIYDVVLEKKAV